MKFLNYKILISILVSVLLTPYISDILLYQFTSDIDVKISRSGSTAYHRNTTVWGYGFGSYIYNTVNSEFYKNNASSNTDYLVPPPHNREYIKINKDGFISLTVKKSPFSWIGIYKGVDAGTFDIYINNKLYKTINAETTYAQSAETRIYLFANSNSIVLLWFLKLSIFYVFIAAVFYFILVLLEKAFKYSSSRNINEKLLQPANSFYFFIIWFAFSFILFSVWMNFDTTWLKVGDAQWYVSSYKFWNGNHIFDINNYAITQHFTPRSYITGIIPYIAYLLSFQSIPLYYYIYFIFAAFSISLFMNIIIPKIYELLSGKKPSIIQTQLFAILFFFYWWNYIYNPLTDVYTIIFLALSFVFYLLYNQKYNMLCIFLSGVCFSLAVLYRGNYLLWFYILVIMFIIKLIRLKIIGIFHKNYLCILFFVIGIILPTIPQIYISYIHDGIFSLYAYDKVGVYRSPTQTLIEEGTSNALYFLSGFPWIISNDVMISQLNNILPFANPQEFNIPMVLLAYFTNIVTSIVALANRFLCFMFPVQIVVYSEPAYNIVAKIILFYIPRVLNIFLISLFILFLTNKDFRRKYLFNKKYIIYYLFIIVYFTAPLLSHVEARYFLFIYVLFYYIIAYNIIPKFLSMNNKKEIILKYIKAYSLIVLILTYVYMNMYT